MNGTCRGSGELQQAGLGEGVRLTLPHDEVIHHPDVDHGQGGFEPIRERAISGRGLGHPRGMLVRQDQRRRVEGQGAWTTTRGYTEVWSTEPLNNGS